MATINDHYLKLKAGYLFPEIARRVNTFAKENPQAKIIRLGIGDVTEPLPAAVVEARSWSNSSTGPPDRRAPSGTAPDAGRSAVSRSNRRSSDGR